MTIPEQKAALKVALRNMRYAGLMAHGNFLCCKGCGQAEMHDRKAKGEKAKGYAFWHEQDEADRRAGEDFYFAYGEFDGEGLTTRDVGAIVAGCLYDAGLSIEWDGDPDTRIMVRGAKSPPPPPASPVISDRVAERLCAAGCGVTVRRGYRGRFMDHATTALEADSYHALTVAAGRAISAAANARDEALREEIERSVARWRRDDMGLGVIVY